jgi:hypothetical protein
MDVLPVGRHDDEHHGGDDERDLPRERIGGEAGDSEGQEELVRCVRDRRQRIAGEHRQGDPLRQQGLAEPVAVHRAADQQPLDRVRDLWHKVAC